MDHQGMIVGKVYPIRMMNMTNGTNLNDPFCKTFKLILFFPPANIRTFVFRFVPNLFILIISKEENVIQEKGWFRSAPSGFLRYG